MNRKHDILVFVRPISFLPLPISEDEAADRFGKFMCDQLRNLMFLLIVFYSQSQSFPQLSEKSSSKCPVLTSPAENSNNLFGLAAYVLVLLLAKDTFFFFLSPHLGQMFKKLARLSQKLCVVF